MIETIGDRRVFPVGLGTYGMGGYQSRAPGTDSKYVSAIQYALAKGINVIDTAEMYASGHTEEIVGKAVSTVNRRDVFIISKVWPTHLERRDLQNSLEGSLKRLNVDYIDLYLIHWPSTEVPLDESIGALMELKDQGKIRQFGVSNFDENLMEDAITFAGKGQIIANEIEYNYGNRKEKKDLIDFCKKRGVTVIAYSPLSRGNYARSEKIEKMAKKYSRSELQIGLRLVMEDALPIPKASSQRHIDELFDAASIDISREDLNYLRE
ncbi:MAG: aldo/keto reductase [Thermoplasmataceae archaeon]